MSLEDNAQQHELREWEYRNVHRPKLADGLQPGDAGYGPPECVECDDDMPAVRRSYGFRVCVPCQEHFERGGAGRRAI